MPLHQTRDAQTRGLILAEPARHLRQSLRTDEGREIFMSWLVRLVRVPRQQSQKLLMISLPIFISPPPPAPSSPAPNHFFSQVHYEQSPTISADALQTFITALETDGIAVSDLGLLHASVRCLLLCATRVVCLI